MTQSISYQSTPVTESPLAAQPSAGQQPTTRRTITLQRIRKARAWRLVTECRQRTNQQVLHYRAASGTLRAALRGTKTLETLNRWLERYAGQRTIEITDPSPSECRAFGQCQRTGLLIPAKLGQLWGGVYLERSGDTLQISSHT